MKTRIITVLLLVLAGIFLEVEAQTDEKSSGVIKFNMAKKPVVSEEDEQKNADGNVMIEESTRSSEGSLKVTIPMGQRTATELNGEVNGFTWIAPTYTSVKTSEDAYEIKTTVNSEENIRFVNLFNNGQFIRNIIPPVSTIRQMVIEEPMELHMGSNELKIEVVTVSGKKMESSVEIVYDISTAKYYALVIAVEEYDHNGLNDLDQPVIDANKFASIINKKYHFEEENIDLMINPTKADIIGKLHSMRDLITPEDNLLIYYAGHGWWDEEMSTGYWLPRDADPSNPVNWLPNTDLTNYLNVLKSKHTLLIADACFSGGIFKSRAAFNNVMEVENLYKLPSRKALTSGALKEVPDRSVFIEYLIKRLDNNRKKYLPAQELYTSMREAVVNNDPMNNVPQYGTIQNVGDEGGDFIFIRRDNSGGLF